MGMATFSLESFPLEPLEAIRRLFEHSTTFLSPSDVQKQQNKHYWTFSADPWSPNLDGNSSQKCLPSSSPKDLVLPQNVLFCPEEIEEWPVLHFRDFYFFTDLSFFQKNRAFVFMVFNWFRRYLVVDLYQDSRNVTALCATPESL